MSQLNFGLKISVLRVKKQLKQKQRRQTPQISLYTVQRQLVITTFFWPTRPVVIARVDCSGEDGSGVVGRPAEENSRGPAVRPGKEMQEGGGVLLGCVEDGLARRAVERVLAV
jgi:hypothetical protein